jgi:hypothetical protein
MSPNAKAWFFELQIELIFWSVSLIETLENLNHLASST